MGTVIDLTDFTKQAAPSPVAPEPELVVFVYSKEALTRFYSLTEPRPEARQVTVRLNDGSAETYIYTSSMAVPTGGSITDTVKQLADGDQNARLVWSGNEEQIISKQPAPYHRVERSGQPLPRQG